MINRQIGFNMTSLRVVKLFAFVFLCFFCASSCKKSKDVFFGAPNVSPSQQTLKIWLYQNGISFKNESIKIDIDSSYLIGHLNWKGARIQQHGDQIVYIRVPYDFHAEKKAPGILNKRATYYLVFRKIKTGPLEAAILTATFDKIDDAKNGIHSQIVQSYRSLDGEPLTLWTKKSGYLRFYKVKREIEKVGLSGAPTRSRISNQGCTTYFFTDSYWNCYSSGNGRGNILDEVVCTIRYRTSSYQLCLGGELQTETDWIADDDIGGPILHEQPDPCATVQAKIASSFASAPDYKNALSQIQNAADDGNEHGISFGKDANGNVLQSPISTGNEHSATVGNVPNLFADLHNHQDNNPPSSGDIYGFIDRVLANPNYGTRYVVTANKSVYALAITDKGSRT